MPTLCLNMIVKNEARVIRRCLDSVRPFINSWVIVDTGSDDGTQAIVREHLAGLPGELLERPWRDFGHNRTEAIALAQGKAQYLLFIDADEVLFAPDGYALPPLTADAYRVRHETADRDIAFNLPNIVRAGLDWRYVGVMHEYVTCSSPHTTATLPAITIRGFFDGARNADPKAKYERDAAVLERALAGEPDNARHAFYLAQSYRDAGRPRDAVATYERRAAMGGWEEEVWYSFYQVAALEERLGADFARLLAAYLRAYQYRPQRSEPLCHLARICRERRDFALAHLFAARAAGTPRPDDVLFVDESVYGWRAVDELSIAEYWTGRHAASAANCRNLLSGGRLPAAQRPRVIANLNFALKAMGEPEYRE